MRKRNILIILIISIALFGYSAVLKNKSVDVDLSKVKKGDIYKYIEETGVVKLENETVVYSVEGGKIWEILVDVGDDVKAGDILAKIEDENVSFQIKGLNEQKQFILAQYEEEKKAADNEEITKLRAQVRSAEVSYEELKRAAENNKKLYEEDAVSFDIYQKSLSNMEVAKANLEVAKSNLAMAQKGISSNIKKQYESRIGEIQAQIDLLEKKRRNLTIVSSVDGTVMASEIKIGSIVQSGGKIMEIGDKNNAFIESDILIDDIEKVNVGDVVLIDNEDMGITEEKGTIRKIFPRAFSKTSDLGIEQKRVKVEINFKNNIKNLKPGYDMDIKIIAEGKKNTILVDEDSVFEYNGKNHVFVNEKGTAKLRLIKKGIESDKKVEILKGLKEGEEVILSPDEKLKEGIKIK